MEGTSIPEPGFVRKTQAVTPLDLLPALDPRSVRTLRALSVTSVEELLGLVAADPDAVADFLPRLDLPQIQADATSVARSAVLAEMEGAEPPEFGMGARAPENIEVEERASLAYVEEWLPEAAVEVGRDDAERPARILSCFGDVRNQGKRGTCVAHATVAVLECQEARLKREKNDLSEQFVYWNAKENDGSPAAEGTWLRVAMPLVEREGACREDVWPYNPAKVPGNEGQGPPPANAAADAAQHLLEQPVQLDARRPAPIRENLDAGRPVAISVPVYRDWYFNPATSTLGLIPMPLPNSVLEGGHAVCLAGYGWDPEFAGGGFFVVRNSWGVGWAPQSPLAPGYGAIPFLYVERYAWEAWGTST